MRSIVDGARCVDAVGAVVGMAGLRERLGTDGPAFLTHPALRAWQAIRSAKRKLEFAAGRLACKAAVRALQRSTCASVAPFLALQVDRPDGTWPVCRHADGRRWQLALSHNAEFAIALCPTGRFDIVVDVESLDKRIVPDAGYFHPGECRPAGPEQTVWRWTIKEACAKLLGHGVRDYFNEIQAHACADGWRVQLPPAMTACADYEQLLCVSIGNSALTIALGRRRADAVRA